MGCGLSRDRSFASSAGVPRPSLPRPQRARKAAGVTFADAAPIATLGSDRGLTHHDPHPHTPRMGDSPEVAHARRVGREVSERWVAHHTQRTQAQAAADQAHVEELRAETLARLLQEAEAHRLGLEKVRAEEARVLGAHLARVAEDADIVHPREAKEWPTEHVHVRALAVLPQGGAPGSSEAAQQLQQLRVASASDDALVRIFALSTGEGGWVEGTCVAALAGHGAAVLCLAGLPPHGLASGGRDGLVGLWDVAPWGASGGRCLRMLSAHRGAVLALAALPDGRLASAGEDGAVRLWAPEARTTECQLTLWGHGRHESEDAVERGRDDVCALAAVALPQEFSSSSSSGSGRWGAAAAPLPAASGQPCLASGGMDGVVLLWDMSLGAAPAQPRAQLRGHTSCINALVQLMDGRLAASARDGSVRLWDLRTMACAVLTGHPSIVLCLALHPDGERLLSGSADGSVHVWDVLHPDMWSVALEPQVHGQKDGIWAMGVLGDGTVLSGGFGATVRTWDVEESHIKWRPELSSSPRGAARSNVVASAAAQAAVAAAAAAAAAAEAAASSAPPSRSPSPRTRSQRSLTGSSRVLVSSPTPPGNSADLQQSIRFISRS